LEFRSQILVVQLILEGRTDEAVALLAKHYNVAVPKIKVGLPKGYRSSTVGCYTTRSETISVLNSDTLREPSIILHEFYHHLRNSPVARRHKGTEKHATRFAKYFVDAYKSARTKTNG